MAKHKISVGDTYKTNNFGCVVVTHFNNSKDVGIVFVDSGYTRSVTTGNLVKGKVLDPTVPKPKWRVSTTLEGFLSEALLEHGVRYSYSKVIYVDTTTEVEIVCREDGHGSFWQTPEKHKSGRGCPICAGKAQMTANRFKARSPHPIGKYNYDLILDSHFNKVKNKVAEVPIVCDVHGLFYQRYDNHLSGQGCSKCAVNGFNATKHGTLYVLKEDKRVKVGITNRNIDIRLKEINKPDGNFSVVESYSYKDGSLCAKHETEILRFMRSLYNNTQGTFNGVTESFEDVDVEVVLSHIRELRENVEKGFRAIVGSA